MKTEYNRFKEWQEKYHECLALEFSKPNYFVMHHLLVLTFMLQTNGYKEEYFPFAKDLLKKFLNNTLTTSEFSKQFKSLEIRNAKMYPVSRKTETYEWNLDILSLRIDTPEHYCKDVIAWANDVILAIEKPNLKL